MSSKSAFWDHWGCWLRKTQHCSIWVSQTSISLTLMLSKPCVRVYWWIRVSSYLISREQAKLSLLYCNRMWTDSRVPRSCSFMKAASSKAPEDSMKKTCSALSTLKALWSLLAKALLKNLRSGVTHLRKLYKSLKPCMTLSCLWKRLRKREKPPQNVMLRWLMRIKSTLTHLSWIMITLSPGQRIL